MKKCPKCGAEISPDQSTCPYCGKELKPKAKTDEATKDPVAKSNAVDDDSQPDNPFDAIGPKGGNFKQPKAQPESGIKGWLKKWF